MVADDLDGVLVRANGAVAAQTPEFALDGALCGGVRDFLLLGRERPVTSSTMPMVNWRFGSAFVISSYTANTLAGGVSLEPRP